MLPLTPWSRSHAIEVEGTRTPTWRIKSLLCCRHTTTSRVVALFVPLKSRHVETSFISTWFHPSVLKLEEETFGQPFRRGQETRAEHAITCWPKNDFLSSHPIGEVGIEPTASSAQDSRTTGVPHPVNSSMTRVGFEPDLVSVKG